MSDLRSGIYLHYSGLVVNVIGVARHEETDEKFIAYVPLGVKEGPRITVRPYDNFFEEVDEDGIKKPRFEYIGEEMPIEVAKKYNPGSSSNTITG